MEHLQLDARNKGKSVLWLHSFHHHQGRADVPYTLRVSGSFKDCNDRNGMETVRITYYYGPVRMNRINEMGGVRVKKMRYRRWGTSLQQSLSIIGGSPSHHPTQKGWQEEDFYLGRRSHGGVGGEKGDRTLRGKGLRSTSAFLIFSLF